MKGNIQRRGDRVYRLRVQLGVDERGKRRVKSETFHGTKRDAERRLAELVNEVNQGLVPTTAPMTISEFLDYWLANYARKRSERTFENYSEYVRLYLKPALGRMKLTDLEPRHIQDFYARLENTGRRNGTPLSPTTVLHTHRILKGALKRAVEWRFLITNPADRVTPPRMAEREPRILTPEQLAIVLNATRGKQLYIPILLAAATGLRRGELCGLRWSDINLETGILTVRQTLICVTQKQLLFKPPKTKSGRRSLPLTSLVVEALIEEQARQGGLRARFGACYNQRDLVICKEIGEPVNPVTLYKNFRDVIDKLGLPPVALHDLRHTHATHLLEQGIHPKVVSERLGHSDPAITLRVYSHVLQHMQQEASDRTDALLRSVLRTTEKDDEEGNQGTV